MESYRVRPEDTSQMFKVLALLGEEMTIFQNNDGGREAAGFKGSTGDCVVRAVTIATQQDYLTVYDALSEGCRTQRRSSRSKVRSSARNGVDVKRKWFRDYMADLEWIWTPTMSIGSGCTVHLRSDELPPGRLIVAVSRHYTAMIDGVIHDLYDPSREETRCVYGYWMKK
jgi:hypothetical protein